MHKKNGKAHTFPHFCAPKTTLTRVKYVASINAYVKVNKRGSNLFLSQNSLIILKKITFLGPLMYYVTVHLRFKKNIVIKFNFGYIYNRFYFTSTKYHQGLNRFKNRHGKKRSNPAVVSSESWRK